MILNLVGLEVHVPTLIWTIINFFLMVFLLKAFLYKPVIKFMDERKKRIDDQKQEAADAQAAILDNEKKLEEELTAQNAYASDIVAQAKAEAQKASAAQLSQARLDAVDLSKNIKSKMADEEAQAYKSVDEHMPEFVDALTKKLLES